MQEREVYSEARHSVRTRLEIEIPTRMLRPRDSPSKEASIVDLGILRVHDMRN